MRRRCDEGVVFVDEVEVQQISCDGIDFGKKFCGRYGTYLGR